MSDTSDVFDTLLGDIQTIKPAPEGTYRVLITDVKEANNPNNGNRGRELHFRLLTPLSGQDMTNVSLQDERVRDTVWVTPKSTSVVRDTVIGKIAPDLPLTLPLREAFELLKGRECTVTLKLETKDRAGAVLRFPRHKVEAYAA